MKDQSKTGEPDPRREVLEAQGASHRQAKEAAESARRDAEESYRHSQEDAARKASESIEETEQIEAGRIAAMRLHRSDLDAEATAAHDVALQMLADLGLPYDAGVTSASSLFTAPKLTRSEAARRAGVPSAKVTADPLLKALKWAGMAGSLILGTFGMGALLLKIQPAALTHSPMLALAVGLGFVLVGGAYLAVVPAARKHGAMAASMPEAEATHRSFGSVCALTVGVAVTVALVDAKALVALNGAKAMIDPSSAPPFAVTLLVASALSATYVIGSAMLSYAEGFAEETEALLEAECAADAREWEEARRDDPDIRQAVEAVGYASTVEKRRRELGKEIEDAGAQLKRLLGDAMASAGSPDAPGGDVTQERDHGMRARLAETRLAAHERHRGGRETNKPGREGRA